ncbi:MAG: hypothetical protein GX584_02720 [Clostridiaceae bacterium]|jgi:YbbR domain-containing protein|nr:hypothetical protein [Clostridiaceae bacterium]
MWNKIKKNLFFKILAVVIAIIIWFIVSVNNNPVEVKTISVPIQIQNERNLALRNLRIINEIDNFIDIQIKGAATEVGKVSSSDFSAYVDFTEIINENYNNLTVKGITYNGDSNITFTYDEEDIVKYVEVEKVITSEFPVSIDFNGQLPEGYYLVAYSVTPNIQSINDVTSMISKIDSIKVSIDLDNVYQSFTVRKACNVYDKDMRILNEYSNTITVDVSITIGKKVNLISRITGTDALGDNHMYISNSLQYSDLIIVGDNLVIKDINTVYTKPFDISGSKESFVSESELDIPSNIKAYSVDNVLIANNMVEISVTIEQLITKRFEYGIEEITIRNKSILQEYTMNEEVFFVTLKGRAVTLASITKNQLTPYVDVFNMNDGNNPAKVNVLSVGTNVTLEDSSTLNVYVETIATYSIDTEKIIKTNVNNELSYSIQAESFNIRLVGLSSNIAKVDTSELAFYINMEDYQEGMHMIDVVVSNESLPEGVRLYDEITIAVMITKQ